MTNLTIQTENKLRENSTDRAYLFESYTVQSWSPFKLTRPAAPLQLRASEIQTHLCADNKYIFTYEILVPTESDADKLGFYWSIYFQACRALIKPKHKTNNPQSDYFRLLEVIRKYSKTNKISSPLDHFLLGLVYYHLGFCRTYGIGTQKNKQEALKSFISASKYGIPQAAKFLTFAETLGLVSPPTKKRHRIQPNYTDTK